MNCSQIAKYFPDYLTGNLDENQRSKFDAHVSDCLACKEEMASLSAVWSQLDSLPEEQPGAALRVRFTSMLNAFKEGQQQASPRKQWLKSLINRLEFPWHWQPAVQLVFGVLLVVLGLVVGYQINPGAGENNELVLLRQEVDNLGKLVTISMLKQQSPIERLRGVNYSYFVEQPDREVLSALLNTLNYDSNLNVRLAAVDALALFYDSKMVGQGLMESLEQQSSPVMQIALIDLFVEMKEKQSTQVLNHVLQGQRLNQTVKKRAERAIQQLK